MALIEFHRAQPERPHDTVLEYHSMEQVHLELSDRSSSQKKYLTYLKSGSFVTAILTETSTTLFFKSSTVRSMWALSNARPIRAERTAAGGRGRVSSIVGNDCLI